MDKSEKKDDECWCEHPFYPECKLKLCGSALCKMLLNKQRVNGHPVIIAQTEEES